MPAPGTSQQHSRAENYRELARQAKDRASVYNTQAERLEKQGDNQIAAEYHQLAAEAKARAIRYEVLADFTDRI